MGEESFFHVNGFSTVRMSPVGRVSACSVQQRRLPPPPLFMLFMLLARLTITVPTHGPVELSG